MEGLGNDFVLVDLRQAPPPAWLDEPAVIRRLCDRHRGVGADGVLAVLPVKPGITAAARMRVLNADGSEAQMCGNGLRCVAKYLLEQDPAGLSRAAASAAPPLILIETTAGVLRCQLNLPPGAAADPAAEWEIEIGMGAPRLQRSALPMLGPPAALCLGEPLLCDRETLRITAVSMGNPHAVIFTTPEMRHQGLCSLAQRVGPLVENHPVFPERTNVELCHRRASDDYEVVVWERGCGLTKACGTGACAVAVAACRLGLSEVEQWIKIQLPGGVLQVRVLSGEQDVRLRGPARSVFRGQLASSFVTGLSGA